MSLRCASSTDEKSASPDGAKKQSETLLQLLAGRLSGRHSLPNVCWMRARRSSQSTFSGVDFVDDDQAVEPALLRVLHEAAGHHLDAVLRVDHDRRGLDRRERGKRVAGEVRVARRVEQVDAGRLVLELRVEARHRELEGVMKLLFPRGIVADGSAALDAAGGVNRSRFREQRLGQGGLAAARLADERDRPDAVNGIRHRPALPPRSSFIAGRLRWGKVMRHSRSLAVNSDI